MDNLLAGTLFSLIRGVSMPVIVQRRCRLLLFVCGEHSAPSRTPFRPGDKNCSPCHRNGVRFHNGMVFGFRPEWCSSSDRNGVHLRPDSPVDIVRNLSFDTKETKLSYLATTPKPRLIQLSIQPEGEETFVSAGRRNKALRFKIHVEIGGITGVVAPMVGKEPPDTHVWISAGQVPAFIRSEEPLYYGGPVLRTELVSPVWPQTPKSEREGQGK
jgi:hypothetical protein